MIAFISWCLAFVSFLIIFSILFVLFMPVVIDYYHGIVAGARARKQK
jgi:hypothetical protein